MIIKRNTIRTLLLIPAFLASCASAAFARVNLDDDPPRARGAIERRADRRFLGQNFQGALSLYEKTLEKERDPACKAALALKIARLYSMVRDYASAARHFGNYMEMGNELPSAADICDYLDALRFLGKTREAEAVCLHYAYNNVYSRHQRYRNALNALTMKYDTTASDYIVLPTRANGPRSEYWVGNFMGKLFYAVSRSHLTPPGKLFFHRTRYRALHAPADPRPRNTRFPEIPRELQCGPVTFSPDAKMLIAAEIVYASDEQIHIDDGRDLSLRTRFVYSNVDENKNRFTRYRPLFRQEPGVSYAHPFLFDNGRALLFSSDMGGGYGGFDLYLSCWDESTGEWNFPVNLGPTVNTEGDEIFPVFFSDELFFASNGHLGLGGYDLFRARFNSREVIPNSLYHLPYPINTSYNDFHVYPIDKHSGYIASDRVEQERDNIFYYCRRDHLDLPGLDQTEQSLLNRDSSPDEVSIGNETGRVLLAVIYFDFDKARVTPAAVQELEKFIKKYGTHFEGLLLAGYADEIGSDDYNFRLSRRRARAIADWLHRNDVSAPLTIEGKGKTPVAPRDTSLPAEKIPLDERIRQNSAARRVEIYLQEQQDIHQLNIE